MDGPQKNAAFSSEKTIPQISPTGKGGGRDPKPTARSFFQVVCIVEAKDKTISELQWRSKISKNAWITIGHLCVCVRACVRVCVHAAI